MAKKIKNKGKARKGVPENGTRTSREVISKKMTFAQALERHPEIAEVFMEQGMHCVGCPMSSGESIEEGCAAHGFDVDEIMKKLNKKVASKKK